MPFKYIIPLKRITNKYSAWSISSLNLPKNQEQSISWKLLTTFEKVHFWHCKKDFLVKKEQQQKRLVQHGMDEICSRGQREVIFISQRYLIRKPVFGTNLTKIRSARKTNKWRSDIPLGLCEAKAQKPTCFLRQVVNGLKCHLMLFT